MVKLRDGLVALGCMVFLVQVQGADIYRWVDDQGRTHLSDVVPDRYRDAATRIDSRQFELTPEQRREAEERAARDTSRASKPEPGVPAPSEPQTPAPEASPSPPVKRPVERVTATTTCEAWWRLYRESQECFGPYHTVGGGIKPEAFEHCHEIPSPEPTCGPYRD